ncbi:aminoglycoside adenylyltransferase domain-containing protein [Bacillus sp. FJAT-29814]|uniref:aminoglycoside adenylyltransferase domain-containing protein n=1 Tax=Bacillus sp. FJAT-29814 TaxID=1729688 RepID=UPI00082C0E3F|nr:aminoglycoside adenylyltransferase domain-containing protein [Bacillus sp. FJAT-29814]
MQVPAMVNEVLDTYFSLIDSRCPNLLESYYIYGSVSMGAFDSGSSDIDFFAVVKRSLTEKDVDVLKLIHSEVQGKFLRLFLDGMYVAAGDLSGNADAVGLYFNEGKLQGYKPFIKDHIDAFQIIKYGIVMKGDPGKYGLTVDWDLLLENMLTNLNTYWVGWKKRCEKVGSLDYLGMLFSLESIEWGVLGVTRIYYTLREKDITSKVGAGEYALHTLPSKWHRIINESMGLRKNIKKSYYHSVFERRRDALNYMEFIIQECNDFY